MNIIIFCILVFFNVSPNNLVSCSQYGSDNYKLNAKDSALGAQHYQGNYAHYLSVKQARLKELDELYTWQRVSIYLRMSPSKARLLAKTIGVNSPYCFMQYLRDKSTFGTLKNKLHKRLMRQLNLDTTDKLNFSEVLSISFENHPQIIAQHDSIHSKYKDHDEHVRKKNKTVVNYSTEKPPMFTSLPLIIWTWTVYFQLIVSVTILFFILLTKNRMYFELIDYLVLIFIPILGIFYSLILLFRQKKLRA